MTNEDVRKILDVIQKHASMILTEWLNEQASMQPLGSINAVTQEHSRELLRLLSNIPQTGNVSDITAPAWEDVRDLLNQVSNIRVEQGFSPSETALFVFSLKKPLFNALRQEYINDANALADTLWTSTELIDNLGLFTVEVYQKERERVISQQRREIYELSTPVVQLWDHILAVPLIGTLDSIRTQSVMESVLNKIVETNSRIIIIDITGVPVVDTLVAQHILKTAQATRLMGAECFISGISPQIAQTIVHLGISLNDLVSRATLKEAFALALKRLNANIVKS